jgi:hypothetical protein
LKFIQNRVPQISPLTRNFVFVAQAATTADDSERMKKVLQNKSEEDEKRMVQLEEQLKEARYS